MIYRKVHPKDAINITASKRIEKSTKGDFSQYELTNLTISGDKNNHKKIYSVAKKGERLKGSKTTPKTKTKPISPLKKIKT